METVSAEKVCFRCKESKPLSGYYPNRARYNGIMSECKECSKEMNKIYRDRNNEGYNERRKVARAIRGEINGISVSRLARKNARELRNGLKIKCSACGYNKCKQALHFHHTETKIIKLADAVSIGVINREMSKCVVLCANCHAEVHAGAIDIGGTPFIFRPKAN